MFKSFRTIKHSSFLLPILACADMVKSNSECEFQKINGKNFKKQKINSLENLVLLPGTTHTALAEEVAQLMKVPILKSQISRFSDGEVNINIQHTIRGCHVFIMQSCGSPVSDSIMELLLAISAARRAGAKQITAVIPYFPYKHHRRGMPTSSKHHSKFLISPGTDIAKMLEVMGVDSVIAVDLQRPGQGQEACFFDNSVPLETIVTTNLMKDYLLQHVTLSGPIVVVAPNDECLLKAVKFEKKFKKHFPNTDVQMLGFIHKSSTSLQEDADMHEPLTASHGKTKIKDANIILVDDVIDSASTITILAQRLHDQGAKSIHVIASHGMFSSGAMKRIDESPIDRIFVSNTLPLPSDASKKIQQVSVAALLSRVILTEHFRGNMGDEEYEVEGDD